MNQSVLAVAVKGNLQRLEIAVSDKAACLVARVGFEPTTFDGL
jgi:hypothetical protein